MEYNVAVVGEVDAAKSTLIGVISSGSPDDGRGSARLHVLSLKHEIATGQTSNINTVMVPLTPSLFSSQKKKEEKEKEEKEKEKNNEKDEKKEKKEKNEKNEKMKQEKEVLARFLDLAGHEKYLNTTLCGLTGYAPSLAILVIAANRGITNMTKEHFRVCYSLRIPIVIVISKIDMAPSGVMRETLDNLKNFIRQLKREVNMPLHLYPIDSDDTLARAIKGFDMAPRQVFPLFKVSNTTLTGIDRLKAFLAQPSLDKDTKDCIKKYMEESGTRKLFISYKPYQVVGIGLILFGINRGEPIRKGDKLFVGPVRGTNEFVEIRVKSIHNALRETVDQLNTETTGCIALATNADLSKAQLKQVIITERPFSVSRITAEVWIYSHKSTITVGYNPYLHCGNVSVPGRVLKIYSINEESVQVARSGDHVIFEFELRNPVFIVKNSMIVFREGGLRGIGMVLSCETKK
jgi:GTPase